MLAHCRVYGCLRGTLRAPNIKICIMTFSACGCQCFKTMGRTSFAFQLKVMRIAESSNVHHFTMSIDDVVFEVAIPSGISF